MTTKDNYIKVTDETIISFYKENKNLDFVAMNHIFIDILKSLSSNLTNTINSTINSKVLSMVTDIHTNLNTIKSDIIIKLNESKKEYIDDMKTVITNNSLTNNEKIASFIEKNNDNLLTKTTLIINEVIPKSQDKNYIQIENCIKSFCLSIAKDTTRLLELSSKDEIHIDSIVTNIETKFSKMISTIQQPIITFIQSSEERSNVSIQNIKDNLIIQQTINQKLTTELNDFLNKYKNNSSLKGNVSETELYFLIQSIMPSDEIVKVNNDTANCDLRVNRMDKTKPSILFENKDYSRSVPTDEIKKFERDIQIQKLHGILISQKSPITYKNDFQIDIINGLIHIYISNADYEPTKIKIAIDIIDSLSIKLQNLESNNEEEYSINKEDMDEILEEYRTFISQKLQMIDTIRSVTKQLMDKMEDIQLPNLKKLFMKLGNIENDNDFKCTFCNIWSGKNKASLSAHVRNCKFNPKNKDSNISFELGQVFEDINTTQNIILEPTIQQQKTESIIIEKKNKSSKPKAKNA